MAFRAHSVVHFGNEKRARGRELFAPVEAIANGMLIIANGKIAAVGKNLPWSGKIHDLGDVAILPPVINAHTHLQLSWLAGKTLWGKGFAAWLQSLIPEILAAVKAGFGAAQKIALAKACLGLAAAGTSGIGDTGASLPGALSATHAACKTSNLTGPRFCEWFGFACADSVWPARCAAELAADAELASVCAPAGHALYSTAPEIMQMAAAWCRQHRRVFSFHFAESQEETSLLADGAGQLYELYRDNVLPKSWRPPGLSPLALAEKLGILGPDTLAVHGTQLSRHEIRSFAKSGASLCICARSNHNLATGQPLLADLIEAGILLCLGTDGLTSCQDLDIRNEAAFIRERHDLPISPLWRMATINGASALGLSAGRLVPGAPGRFSVWPLDL